MILQGSLRIEYNMEAFVLMVKVFQKDGTYYFFVSDKEREKPLLAGEILRLTYTDTFRPAGKEGDGNGQKIPADLVNAIKNMLLKNKQLWFYNSLGLSCIALNLNYVADLLPALF